MPSPRLQINPEGPGAARPAGCGHVDMHLWCTSLSRGQRRAVAHRFGLRQRAHSLYHLKEKSQAMSRLNPLVIMNAGPSAHLVGTGAQQLRNAQRARSLRMPTVLIMCASTRGPSRVPALVQVDQAKGSLETEVGRSAMRPPPRVLPTHRHHAPGRVARRHCLGASPYTPFT